MNGFYCREHMNRFRIWAESCRNYIYRNFRYCIESRCYCTGWDL